MKRELIFNYLLPAKNNIRQISVIRWQEKLMPQASTNNQKKFTNEFHLLHERFSASGKQLISAIGAICWQEKLMPQASTNNREKFTNELHSRLNNAVGQARLNEVIRAGITRKVFRWQKTVN